MQTNNRRPTRRQMGLALAASLLPVAGSTPAQAQSQAQPAPWPQRPVKLLLSQPAGSGPDNVARLLAERLSRQWGQAVVVENKPGGQNTIGAQAAARSPADGHHFYFGTTAALVSNVFLFKQLPYDPLKDFVPVAFVARSPFAVLVDSRSPIQTLDDLLARAKAEPGKVALANEGPRTFSGMVSRLLAARAGVDLRQVPYASVGVAVQDTLGGHVDVLVADLASTAALARQGRLRVLATSGAQRVAGWPDVPALAERLPGFEMIGWFAVVAPAGTPADAVQRANRDINQQLADADLAQRIATIGPLVESSATPEQVGEFLRSEHKRWAQISRDIGLLPE